MEDGQRLVGKKTGIEKVFLRWDIHVFCQSINLLPRHGLMPIQNVVQIGLSGHLQCVGEGFGTSILAEDILLDDFSGLRIENFSLSGQEGQGCRKMIKDDS